MGESFCICIKCLPSLAELAWVVGKWSTAPAEGPVTFYLPPGAPREARELLALAGVEYGPLSGTGEEEEGRGERGEWVEPDPLGHLLSGRPLKEWHPERPWRFPELAVRPAAEGGGPFAVLALGSEISLGAARG